MRIAINGRSLIKGRMEGIGHFTWEVLCHMVQLHPQHDYLLLFDRKPAEDFLITGIEYRVLRPAARHPVLYRIWFDVLVPLHVRKWDAEVFVSFDGFTSQYLKIPTVTVIHDLAYLHFPQYMKSTDLRYYQKFQPRFARLSDKLLTVSEYSARDIVRQYGINQSEIDVVYNGSRFEDMKPIENLETLKTIGLEPGRYFIYTGSLHPRKNIGSLVQAFEKTDAATKHGVKLVLAGRLAWQTRELEARIMESPLSGLITMTGYVSDYVLWNLLRHSLALCYVSLFEGFGVPVLDAFHARVPVICSGTTSLKEVAGDACILVDPEDVHTISAAMDEMHENQDLRSELIERGSDRKHIFNWKMTARKAMEAVEEAYQNY